MAGFVDFNGPCDASSCPALTEEEEEEIEKKKNATPDPSKLAYYG